MGCTSSKANRIAPEPFSGELLTSKSKEHIQLAPSNEIKTAPIPIPPINEAETTLVSLSNQVSLFGNMYKLHQSTGSLEHIGPDKKQTIFVIPNDTGKNSSLEIETKKGGTRVPMLITRPSVLGLSHMSTESLESSEPHAAFNAALKLAGSPIDLQPHHPNILSVQEWDWKPAIGFPPVAISEKGSFHGDSSTVSYDSDRPPLLRKAYTMMNKTSRKMVEMNTDEIKRTSSLIGNGRIRLFDHRHSLSELDIGSGDIIASTNTKRHRDSQFFLDNPFKDYLQVVAEQQDAL
jgi:hypothetical protein